MRTPIQIFKKNGIHYYENYENAIEIAMQEYADEFACGFAEWLRDNPEYRNEFSNKLMTTPELLEIYKQQINAKV